MLWRGWNASTTSWKNRRVGSGRPAHASHRLQSLSADPVVGRYDALRPCWFVRRWSS